MNICILAIGKESSSELQKLQQEYERRLKSHATIQWKLMPASKSSNTDQIRDEESALLLDQLKSTDSVILLDERGQQLSNSAFAARFEQLAGTQGRLVFIIGGAFGVNDSLRNRASLVWSLSELVFPHQLVRVMLLEQIYRTYSILSNHPYHHN